KLEMQTNFRFFSFNHQLNEQSSLGQIQKQLKHCGQKCNVGGFLMLKYLNSTHKEENVCFFNIPTVFSALFIFLSDESPHLVNSYYQSSNCYLDTLSTPLFSKFTQPVVRKLIDRR